MIAEDVQKGAGAVKDFARGYAASLMEKSRSIALFFERRMASVGLAWVAVILALSIFRLSSPASPLHNLRDAAPVLIAYAAIIAAPILGYLVARRAFAGEAAVLQPSIRFAVFGKWRKLSTSDARAKAAYGPVGFMASLLVGMMLNVVIRAFEFFAAVPAMGYHAPAWGQSMFALMALDLIVTSFFYMAAFAMALRSIPLFPRMLGFAWLLDITMQLFIARELAAIGGVPTMVIEPLLTLLDGNVTKVLISAAIWLPYLLLSERVNITYRHRTYAARG